MQAVLALWLQQRYGASTAELGLLFFATNLLSALSQALAPAIASRRGLLQTMLVPHFVSNLLLLAVPVSPSFGFTAALLSLRHSLSKIDVPARQAFTAAVVTPEQRTAAASLTTVARSVAVSASPLMSSLLLSGPFLACGGPLLLGGGLAIAYDLSMWCSFRAVPLQVATRPSPRPQRGRHRASRQPAHGHRPVQGPARARVGPGRGAVERPSAVSATQPIRAVHDRPLAALTGARRMAGRPVGAPVERALPGVDQARPPGGGDRARARGLLQLAQHRGHVVRDRLLRQDEAGGDLGVGQTLGEDEQDLHLAFGQARGVGTAARAGSAGHRGTPAAQVTHDRRVGGGGAQRLEPGRGGPQIGGIVGARSGQRRPERAPDGVPRRRGRGRVACHHEGERFGDGLRRRAVLTRAVQPPEQLPEVPRAAALDRERPTPRRPGAGRRRDRRGSRPPRPTRPRRSAPAGASPDGSATLHASAAAAGSVPVRVPSLPSTMRALTLLTVAADWVAAACASDRASVQRPVSRSRMDRVPRM